MIGNWYVWMGIFIVLAAIFVLCLKTAKNRRMYFIYFITGAFLGFYFDIFSFVNGYYYYPDIFPITMLGLPLSMTLAEGFSVAITMRIFELVKVRLALSD